MKTWKIVLLVISSLILLTALDFGFGYLGVFKDRTVGKAKQDAQREIFEQTQSYVEGKRQEALKLYKEYKSVDSANKILIEEIVSHSFANFDENKLDEPLKSFIYNCKYY